MSQPSVHQLFNVLGTEDDETVPRVPQPKPPAREPTQQEHAAAIAMIRIALSALWQRFIVALAELFTIASVGSAFVLWLLIPDPNTKQLVALGMYGAFVAIMNLLVMWSRK